MTDETQNTPEGQEPKPAYNPADHFQKVNNDKAYLPANQRIYWFRQEFPQGSITTEELEVDREYIGIGTKKVYNPEKKREEVLQFEIKGYARYKARVSDGRGGVGEGTKTETAAGFEDYVEKAEKGAIARALEAMGYGTLAAEMYGEMMAEGRIADAPIETNANKGTKTNTASSLPAPVALQMPSIPGLPKPAPMKASVPAPTQQHEPTPIRTSVTPAVQPEPVQPQAPTEDKVATERVELQNAITGYLSKQHLFSSSEVNPLRLRVTGGVDLKVSDMPIEQLRIFKMMLADAYPLANIGYGLNPDGSLLRAEDLKVNSTLGMYGNDKKDDLAKRTLYLNKLIRAYKESTDDAVKARLMEQHKDFLTARGFLKSAAA